MGAADARLEHASAPYRDAAFLRRIVYGDGLGESTDASQLEVDDLARLHLDGGQRITAVANGFVEADGCLQALLEHGMVVEIVVPQRLLDHEQIESVKGDD